MPAGAVLYLDGLRLSKAMRAGIARVLQDTELLNRINVFPVPDGDTGTNLALTLRAVQSALSKWKDRNLDRTIQLIADAALDGARGNSGAILAQYLHGLSDAASGAARWCTRAFSEATQRGADYAREAMGQPREGTILTVIDDFTHELTEAIKRPGGSDFVVVLQRGLDRARRSLANTTNQLEVLRKAGVVDAGAKGFVDLLEGITDFLLHGAGMAVNVDQPGEFPEESLAFVNGEEIDLSHRYCTECVIVGQDLDRRKIREALLPLGSSLVVAGLRNRIRVHIHVNDPDQVFHLAAAHGQVQGAKADDMQRQQRGARAGRQRVAVVTDSAADLPENLVDELGLHVIPVRLHFGNRSYLDKVSLGNDEFYRLLEDAVEPPQTSQPPPGDFRRMYEFLSSHYQHVVSLHVTGKASGTFQAAEAASTRIANPGAVSVVDTLNASVGQGLVAWHAAELAATGASSEQVLQGLRDIIPKTRTYALLSDLSYAVRGGRVAASKKRIADLLRLTPVLATGPTGTIDVAGMLLGRSNTLAKFVRFIRHRQNPEVRYRLLLAHAQCEQRMVQLEQLLRDGFADIESVTSTPLGTALGVHGGPGTLVVSLQERPRNAA